MLVRMRLKKQSWHVPKGLEFGKINLHMCTCHPQSPRLGYTCKNVIPLPSHSYSWLFRNSPPPSLPFLSFSTEQRPEPRIQTQTRTRA
ncbi:hypothetical protein VNO78_28892 [Psophocarpus tetragonolobus]|uniref:Uncharacterized protein n=1 Tax=Psophocarpus tetragonolobus TaxID=3891 RepID=A0AAN9WZQ5_PSOTE